MAGQQGQYSRCGTADAVQQGQDTQAGVKNVCVCGGGRVPGCQDLLSCNMLKERVCRCEGQGDRSVTGGWQCMYMYVRGGACTSTQHHCLPCPACLSWCGSPSLATNALCSFKEAYTCGDGN